MTRASEALEPFEMLASYATAEMIYAADQIGLWAALRAQDGSPMNVAEFISDRGLSDHVVYAITDYLYRVGLLDSIGSGDVIRLSTRGESFLQNDCLGHFELVVGAYGNVLHGAAQLASERKRYGEDIVRDSALLATASTRIGKSNIHSSFSAVLAHVGTAFLSCVVDIGAGAGDFLKTLSQQTPVELLVAIEKEPAICAMARETLSRSPISFEVICADIASVGQSLMRYQKKADLVTALFVLHELIGKGSALADALASIRHLLLPTGRFLLLEKATDVLALERNPPYFSEFKLLHDLTSQNLCDTAAWRRSLALAGFEISREQRLGPNTGSILFECTPCE